MDFKLKSCPFCGKEVEHYTIVYKGPTASELEVACEGCNAQICINVPQYYSDDRLYIFGSDAVERWNNRITQKTEDNSGDEKEI